MSFAVTDLKLSGNDEPEIAIEATGHDCLMFRQ